MFQALFEKFADWLLPFFIGLMVWYGLHYFVLTPRIIKVDQAESYKTFNQDKKLPETIESCIQRNIVPTTLGHARLEAALFTASLKNIAQPYRNKLGEVEAIIDEQCGVSEELAKQAQQQNVIDARDQAIDEMKYWFDMLQEFVK